MRPPRGLAAPFAASILTTNGPGRNRQPARNPRGSRTEATTAMRSPIPPPTGLTIQHAVVASVREPLGFRAGCRFRPSPFVVRMEAANGAARPRGGRMRYALLIYGSEQAQAGMSEAEGAAVSQAYNDFTKDIVDRGLMQAGEALQPVSTATTVRVRGDETLSTD